MEGHEVTVLAPPDQYVGQLREIPRVRFEALSSLDRKSTDLASNVMLWRELDRHYKRLQPDLVIHFTVKPNIIGTLTAWRQNIPSIMVVTGLGYAFLHSGFTQKLARLSFRFAARRASRVVFENGSDLALFVQYGWVKPENGLAVPGCGVDITHFVPREKTTLPKQRFIFTFVGRLLEDKGITEFVEAAQVVHTKYPHALFRIAGNLDEENPAHISRARLAEWLRIPGVEYVGFSDDIRQLYADSDFVVLPSYREGLSRVLLEALAMGRPIITTDTPGCRETVQPGSNGFLVPVRDARALGIAMETAINMSPQALRDFGHFSRRKAVTEFESSLIGDYFKTLINKILSLDKTTNKSRWNNIHM
jgi:glycosyltransferase involved in cell wall biosynthesis